MIIFLLVTAMVTLATSVAKAGSAWFYICQVCLVLNQGTSLRLPNSWRKLPVEWPWVAFIAALVLASAAEEARGHEHAAVSLRYLELGLFLYLALLGGGHIKRWASKLKSAALTTINSASFKRQQAEAFSR